MPSFGYIESAIIFNLNNKKTLDDFPYSYNDFAQHGEKYLFVLDYYTTRKKFPEPSILIKTYDDLDVSSQNVDFGYSLDVFEQQILHRKIVSVINSAKPIIDKDAKKALNSLIDGLTTIDIQSDNDLMSFSDRGLTPLEDYEKKNAIRYSDKGMLGIPTAFSSVNNEGIGWMKGELISLYARPSIGKTWLAVMSAVVSMYSGYRTLFISTEMTTSQINLRFDVCLGRKMGYELSHHSLRSGEDMDTSAYKEYLSNVDKSLYVCDHISGSDSIKVSSLAHMIRKHSPEFVVIDGVYLLETDEKSSSAWESNHSLINKIKNLAKSYSVPIMVVTQANRDASDIYTPPEASSVAFGDAILRASDMVLSMCQVKDFDDQRLVEVQKHRDGGLYKSKSYLRWNVNYGEIDELEIDEYAINNDF